jgi:hypothetical protein
MTAQLDHVARGLAETPEKLRGPRIQAYLAVYLAQFNSIEDAVWTVLDAFTNWQTSGAQLDFVLEIIGALLDQPRPDGFDNESYTFILRARVLVRRSTAIRTDVERVVRWLAQGQPYAVLYVVPKVVIIEFIDLVLTPQEQGLYEQLLLDAVDAVDQISVNIATSATASYDIGLYDQDLYA